MQQQGGAYSLSSHAERAIEVLHSFLGIITAVSWTPVRNRDLWSKFARFDARHGMSRIAENRDLIDKHLKLTEELCKMPDNDVQRLEQGRGSSAELRALRDKEKRCKAAIQLIDRPNTHRLRELVDTTHHMMGRFDDVAEMVLERRHQILKRSIQTSNYKARHDHAMRCALLNDWQGRLTLSIADARKGDKKAQLACFRLLAGREAVHSSSGAPSDQHLQSVLRTLHDANSLEAELELQGMSVLSGARPTAGYPKLSHRKIHESSIVDIESRNLLDEALLNLSDEARHRALELKEVNLQSAPQSALRKLRKHTVLRILQHHQRTSTQDTVLVPVPANGEFNRADLESAEVRFWCIRHLFLSEAPSGARSYFAEVLPVQLINEAPNGVLNTYRVSLSASPSLLRLHPLVQITATLHLCGFYGCTINISRYCLSHCHESNRLNGNLFYILSSDTGYPPRSG